MIRKRLLTVLTFQDGVLFRTKLFNPDYRYTLNFVDAWSIDEIVLLDISRPNSSKRDSFYKIVQDFAKKCFVPLSVGGKINSIEEASILFSYGADKVVLNTAAVEKPELISDISRLYGQQSVVLSIDAKVNESGFREVFTRCGTFGSGLDPIDWSRNAESLGAGEILYLPMERDGWLQGMDVDFARQIVDSVNIPVLLLGGAGNWGHMADAFNKSGVSGVCTQNIYHFTDASIKSAKKFLRNSGIEIRD